jgi:hypothetical protein
MTEVEVYTLRDGEDILAGRLLWDAAGPPLPEPPPSGDEDEP